MPTISMFFGILIRMYQGRKEHNPPHFHASYQSKEGVFNIQTGEFIKGDLPKRQIKIVEGWAAAHQDELLANWELAQNDELPYKIEPMK